jgi:flagellar biosynthesis protein FlhB
VGRFDGKTEKATPQRRRKAREEGQVARSAEISVAVSLICGVLAARMFLPGAIDVFSSETRSLFAGLTPSVLPGDRVASSSGRMLLAVIGPFAGVAVIAALAAGFGQVGVKLAPKAARPKLSNLSPKKGLEKLRPSTMAWELTRTAAKLGLLVLAVWSPLTDLSGEFRHVRSIDDGLGLVAGAIWTLFVRGVLVAVVIAVADYLVNRRRTDKQLRMTKQEVKQEHKDQEGDPLLKAQRRRRAMDLSRNRMLRDVATADVVLVNPTELAIALRYDPADAAPRVVAKGADHLAARIRAEARRHGVPVTADKPLCRAVYKRCKVGDHVPAALFEAVAVVLAWAYRRTGRIPGERVAA